MAIFKAIHYNLIDHCPASVEQENTMSEENEIKSHQIKSLREMSYRQLEDCASFINVSIDRYKQIEENERLVTLPELELLGILFQTSTTTLLKGETSDKVVSPLSSSTVRTEFKKLRNKMILARIEIACQEQGISIQELLEKINISVDAVESYEDGIPKDHLLFICNELSLNVESLLEGSLKSTRISRPVVKDKNEEPEFNQQSSDSPVQDWDDEDFDDLVSAIKRAPKDEQALLARILLEELKEF